MDGVLADTSAWIDYFRRGQGKMAVLLDQLLTEDRVALCGIVEMELLRGILPSERKKMESVLKALRFVETLREDFIMAGNQLNRLKEQGITIPATDALIWAVCQRKGLSLLTLDEHFAKLPHLPRVKG